MEIRTREKVATREVAEPGEGGGVVEPVSVGVDWGGGVPSLEGGVGVVPEGGGEGPCDGDGALLGAGEEPVTTLTLNFWPALQWLPMVHAK